MKYVYGHNFCKQTASEQLKVVIPDLIGNPEVFYFGISYLCLAPWDAELVEV